MKSVIPGILVFFLVLPLFAEEPTGFGIRAMAGVDTSLLPVAGAGAGYILSRDENMSVELGLDFYYYGYAQSSTNTVSVLIYAVTANMLFNYTPEKAGMYELAGAGVGGHKYVLAKYRLRGFQRRQPGGQFRRGRNFWQRI